MDVPAGLQYFDFHYTCFLSSFTTHQYTNFIKKHPILLKLGAFYGCLLKLHPIYVNQAPSPVIKKPRSLLYQNLQKSAPKGRHIYGSYIMPMWEPPMANVSIYLSTFQFNMFNVNLFREVNKNNLLGGQFLTFLPKKSGKIINWMGNLQFLTQIMYFFLGHFDIWCPFSAIIG